MKLKLIIVALATMLFAVGCTSIEVLPVASKENIQKIYIINNPKVVVDDFVSVLQDGFSRHNIATVVVEESQMQASDVTLRYVARRSWDIAPYLSTAELRLWRDGKLIGSADYRLRGGGGLSLNKWDSVKIKMDPVIDRLVGSN